MKHFEIAYNGNYYPAVWAWILPDGFINKVEVVFASKRLYYALHDDSEKQGFKGLSPEAEAIDGGIYGYLEDEQVLLDDETKFNDTIEEEFYPNN